MDGWMDGAVLVRTSVVRFFETRGFIYCDWIGIEGVEMHGL